MSVRKRQPEQALQRSVAQLLDMILAAPTEWTAIGHGGGGATRGGILKSMGLKPGWPDIIISSPIEHSRGRSSLMVGLELKSKDGTVSHHQKVVHAALEKSGWQIFVCRSPEEVISALRVAGIPSRPVNVWPSGALQLSKEKVHV